MHCRLNILFREGIFVGPNIYLQTESTILYSMYFFLYIKMSLSKSDAGDNLQVCTAGSFLSSLSHHPARSWAGGALAQSHPQASGTYLVKALLGCGPDSGGLMSRQSRAVGSWSLALLWPHWGSPRVT